MLPVQIDKYWLAYLLKSLVAMLFDRHWSTSLKDMLKLELSWLVLVAVFKFHVVVEFGVMATAAFGLCVTLELERLLVSGLFVFSVHLNSKGWVWGHVRSAFLLLRWAVTSAFSSEPRFTLTLVEIESWNGSPFENQPMGTWFAEVRGSKTHQKWRKVFGRSVF